MSSASVGGVPQQPQRRVAWAGLLVSVPVFSAASPALGEISLFSDDSLSDDLRAVALRLRAWRLGNSMLAGGALAVAGVLVQGLFRNPLPLASPSILGTSAGASLGGVIVLLLGTELLAGVLPAWMPTELLLPIGCLGGVEAKASRHFALALPMVLGATGMALGWGRHLDLLLSGHEEAESLGVDVNLVRPSRGRPRSPKRRWPLRAVSPSSGSSFLMACGRTSRSHHRHLGPQRRRQEYLAARVARCRTTAGVGHRCVRPR